MSYDKELLEFCRTEDWATFLERNNAFAKNVSTEGFKSLEQRYFTELKRKINCCLKILETNKEPEVYYTLAYLHDKNNLDEFKENLYKRPTRFFCIKAIRADRQYAKAWALLSHAYSWVSFLGGNEEIVPSLDATVGENIVITLGQQNFLVNGGNKQKSVRYIGKAIFCIRQAVKYDPFSRDYQEMLNNFYKERNDEFGE